MPTFHSRSPIAFAHRGGKAHFRENTLVAFEHALRSGLTAVETDAWLSKDGEVVLDHDGRVRSIFRMRPRRIGQLTYQALPNHVPTLAQLCQLVGPDVDVQIDVKGDSDISHDIVEVWRTYLPNSMDRLWLAHDGYKTSDAELVSKWRELDDQIHLVDSTSVSRFDVPAGEYAARAKHAGLEVINLPGKEWHRDLVKIVHDAGLLAFGFGAQKLDLIEYLIDIDIDGVYSDHVDRLLVARQQRDST